MSTQQPNVYCFGTEEKTCILTLFAKDSKFRPYKTLRNARTIWSSDLLWVSNNAWLHCMYFYSCESETTHSATESRRKSSLCLIHISFFCRILLQCAIKGWSFCLKPT